MKNIKLEKCINELRKCSKNRNYEIIIDYLKTLEPLMKLLEEKFEKNEEIITKLAPIMIYEEYKENDIIIKYGEKVDNIYIILNGNICILSPKFNEYYMNEEEFILYLLKLRKNNQKEILNQCIKFNAHNFSLNQELLIEFLLNLESNNMQKGFIYKSRKIIKAVKNLVKHIKLNEDDVNEIKTENISPEKYISFLEIDEEIIKNTEYILKEEMIKDGRKLVKIPNYEQKAILKEGEIICKDIMDNSNNKRNETLIALSECDLIKINKIQYHELMKEFIAKIKNKFYNLILNYKIFNNIPYSNFIKKYYQSFKYMKVTKNQVLFNEGDICDKLFFISNGEYELFFDGNIQEINNIILRLNNILDDLKAFIIDKRKKIIDQNIHQSKIYMKLKNNLYQFFSKYENEINLKKIIHQIKNKELNRKILEEKNLFKIYSHKRRIKLGIYKSRQIIGLNDIINRNEGNFCLFNCKCSSFHGELCYIPYNKFLSIYESEDKVDLYTNELLFQNIYYIIERLVSHKKYIIESSSKLECEVETKLNNDIKQFKSSRNAFLDKIKIKFINSFCNKRSAEKSPIKNNYNKDLTNKQGMNLKKIVSYFDNNSSGIKNTYNKRNKIKISKQFIKQNLSEKINFKEDTNEESNIITSISKITNKNLTNNSFQTMNKIKFNLNSSRNMLSKKLVNKQNMKSYGINTIRGNSDIEIPALVINDKEVKVNEIGLNHNFTNKSNYEKFWRYSNSFEHNKIENLFNSNEIKNLLSFGDFNERIEKKLNMKLLKKTKNLIRRNYLKKYPLINENIKFELETSNFKLTPFNSMGKDKNKKNERHNTNSIKNNKCRNINNHKQNKQIKKNLNNLERNVKNIIFNRKKLLNFEKPSFLFKSKTFNNGKKDNNQTKKFLFRNTFLKKNLSEANLFNDKNNNNKDDNNKIIDTNKIFNFFMLKNNRRNKFIQTPNSFMISFNNFKRKMEKLNVI